MTEKHVLFDIGQGLYVGSHSTTDKTVKAGEFVFPPYAKLQERDRAYEFKTLKEAQESKAFLDRQFPLLKLTIITEKQKEKVDEV
jgi:hypothetical protein